MAHDTMSGGDRQQQQTGQYRMYTCRDCGAAFSAVYSAKARGEAVPHVCPECLAEHKRENSRQCKVRKWSSTARKAMMARLAARDAEYERGGHAAESRVTVRDGLRVKTRGRVCGSPVGVITPPRVLKPTSYLHIAQKRSGQK